MPISFGQPPGGLALILEKIGGSVLSVSVKVLVPLVTNINLGSPLFNSNGIALVVKHLRPRHVRVPARIPCITHAHLAIADLYVEIGSTVVDQDIEAAVLRRDAVESSVDGAVGAKIDLDDGESAGGSGNFGLDFGDGVFAFAGCTAADD